MSIKPPMSNRRFLTYALSAGALFLAVRFLFFSQISDSPVLRILILDSEYYYRWAVGLAQGHGHPAGPFWLSPLYPLFMVGVYQVLGGLTPQMVVVVQFLLSLGTLAALVWSTRVLFGPTVALVTAALAALYAPWLYYDGTLLSASLILFLNAIALLLLIISLEQAKRFPAAASALKSDLIWAAVGILLGLSALARPSVLIFAAALAGWVVIGKLATRWRKAAFLVAAIALVLIPVLIRNYRVSGSLILTTSSGGVNFFIGNRAGASGIYDELDFILSFDPEREAEGYRAEASSRAGRELTLTEASRYWSGQAFDDILHSPGGWLKLQLNKLWLTIQREEIPNNLSFRGVAGFAPIVGALPIRWGLLFPFAVVGVFLAWRKRPDLKLLWIYGGAYLAVNLIFFTSSEYRFPLLLVLLPAAGCFFVELWRCLIEKNYHRLIVACLLYVAALFVVNFPSRMTTQASKPHGDYYNMATTASDYRKYIDAVPLYARALAIQPDYQPARIGLADALWRLGNFDDARQEYAMAGITPPDSLSGAPLKEFLEQLYFYTEENDYPGALAFLNAQFPPDKDAPLEIWLNRAMVELGLGHRGEALKAVARAMSMDKEDPDLPYRAGLIALENQDAVLADSLFALSLKRYPAYAPTRIAIARRALEARDTLAARAQLDELKKIFIPDDSVRVQAQRLAVDLGLDRETIPTPQE